MPRLSWLVRLRGSQSDNNSGATLSFILVSGRSQRPSHVMTEQRPAVSPEGDDIQVRPEPGVPPVQGF